MKRCSAIGPRDFSEPSWSSTTICLVRAPLIPVLSLCEEDKRNYTLFQAFKSPVKGHTTRLLVQSSNAQSRTLGVRLPRKSFVAFDVAEHSHNVDSVDDDDDDAQPLVLWEAEYDHCVSAPGNTSVHTHKIVVDSLLTRVLRQHQREGVQFVFNCLMGVSIIPASFCVSGKDTPVSGCILADDMGLGKTLQSITVLWTLLEQGFSGAPAVRKALIVCPASLVKNWGSEIDKWLRGRCKYTPVTGNTREKIIAAYEGFRYDFQSRILITSYETLRLHGKLLEKCPIDCIICDEAHRLKNEKTKVVAAVTRIPTTRRLLLSGTPVQNDLDELFVLASLCLPPDVLGDILCFRKVFTNPVALGQSPNATDVEQQRSQICLKRLSDITNSFVLRRTNVLLAAHLPSKTLFAIFCRLSPLQIKLYTATAKALRYCQNLTSISCDFTPKILAAIQTLMKICNHPSLLNSQELATNEQYRKTTTSRKLLDASESGKLLFLLNLMLAVRQRTWTADQCGEKIVVISNFTQTLDVVGKILQQMSFSFLRLDGHTSVAQRHSLVQAFNDRQNPCFVFLLSSKAGGCGINLVGANRLVMFDPDWNPAHDKQALARIWREGQEKHCFVYRLFSTGTIDEKIFQRQLQKDTLSSLIVESNSKRPAALAPTIMRVDVINSCSDDEKNSLPRSLLDFNDSTLCETHDLICSSFDRCPGPTVASSLMSEADLSTWAHHQDPTTVSDDTTLEALRTCYYHDNLQPVVSFVMSAQIEACGSNGGVL